MDYAVFLPAALAAADAAGAAIRPWFRAGLTADRKADDSPVTRADREAEAAMRSVLARHHPGHGVLGEEAGLDRAGASLRWVLDPIDGTRAFITGRPVFGTLIALLEEGRPVLGIIDQPVLGERWIGVAGHATAFAGPFGGRAGTRRPVRLEEAELSATSPEMLGEAWPRFRRLAGRVRRLSWGGDCYAYGLLALGGIDIIAERDLKIWDWAALVPVIEGAGGRVTDWQGRALAAMEDGARGPGEVLAVGDPSLLRDAAASLA